MIKTFFSKRHKCKVYRLDATVNGKRFRRYFLKKSEAEAVAYKVKHDAIAKRYGLPVAAERPFLADLVEKRLDVTQNENEHTRATRVLYGLLELLPKGYCVDELTKADIQKYVDKRRADGLQAQSIDRELNIIGAMVNQIDFFYPQLEQWRPPRMPRPKIIGGRRERVWSAHEIKSILGELFAPKHEGEQTQSARARYRVGRKVQFCLLNGVRHSEMNLIRPSDIDWHDRTIRIRQGKTGNYKTIGPARGDVNRDPKGVQREQRGRICFFQGREHYAKVLQDSQAGLPTSWSAVRQEHSRRSRASRRTAHRDHAPSRERRQSSDRQRVDGMVRKRVCSLLLARK